MSETKWAILKLALAVEMLASGAPADAEEAESLAREAREIANRIPGAN